MQLYIMDQVWQQKLSIPLPSQHPRVTGSSPAWPHRETLPQEVNKGPKSAQWLGALAVLAEDWL